MTLPKIAKTAPPTRHSLSSTSSRATYALLFDNDGPLMSMNLLKSWQKWKLIANFRSTKKIKRWKILEFNRNQSVCPHQTHHDDSDIDAKCYALGFHKRVWFGNLWSCLNDNEAQLHWKTLVFKTMSLSSLSVIQRSEPFLSVISSSTNCIKREPSLAISVVLVLWLNNKINNNGM